MFDIGWVELLIIAVVAIIVVGPKDLPGMLRTLGRGLGQVRRMASEFRSDFEEAIRESELDELRSGLESIHDANPVNQIKDAVNETLNPLHEAAEDVKSGIESAGTKDDATAQSDTPDADALDTDTDFADEGAVAEAEPQATAEPEPAPASDTPEPAPARSGA